MLNSDLSAYQMRIVTAGWDQRQRIITRCQSMPSWCEHMVLVIDSAESASIQDLIRASANLRELDMTPDAFDTIRERTLEGLVDDSITHLQMMHRRWPSYRPGGS